MIDGKAIGRAIEINQATQLDSELKKGDLNGNSVPSGLQATGIQYSLINNLSSFTTTQLNTHKRFPNQQVKSALFQPSVRKSLRLCDNRFKNFPAYGSCFA